MVLLVARKIEEAGILPVAGHMDVPVKVIVLLTGIKGRNGYLVGNF